MLEKITLPNRHCPDANYVERLRDAEAWEVSLAVPGDDMPVQDARETLEDIGLAVRLCEHMNQLENA